MIDTRKETSPDLYGHGTHVASVAAGRGLGTGLLNSGIAPNANLYDVKVLDETGAGEVTDVLKGIDWVIMHSKEFNLRVMNLSLSTNSLESYETDPLCRAVRSAVAAGITVIVSAGNYGKSIDGKEIYGSISSPGNEPSAITIGSANPHATLTRTDDVVNTFSSRGPTRGGYVTAAGVRHYDNLLKPDLVAPGNKIISAQASSVSGFNQLVKDFPQLRLSLTATAPTAADVMQLSGTSVLSPVVSGTVALLLQRNPGLTPPLIKALLQSTAQQIPNANLAQQGAGLLNIEGAIWLASVLRTDIKDAIAAGTIKADDSLLAVGKSFPTQSTIIGGESFKWGRYIFAGGSYILKDKRLFRNYQPFYNPGLLWVRNQARFYSLWLGSGNSVMWLKGFSETTLMNTQLATPNVVNMSSLAGAAGPFVTGVSIANGAGGWRGFSRRSCAGRWRGARRWRRVSG